MSRPERGHFAVPTVVEEHHPDPPAGPAFGQLESLEMPARHAQREPVYEQHRHFGFGVDVAVPQVDGPHRQRQPVVGDHRRRLIVVDRLEVLVGVRVRAGGLFPRRSPAWPPARRLFAQGPQVRHTREQHGPFLGSEVCAAFAVRAAFAVSRPWTLSRWDPSRLPADVAAYGPATDGRQYLVVDGVGGVGPIRCGRPAGVAASEQFGQIAFGDSTAVGPRSMTN